MDKKEFINNLKVGDKIAVRYSIDFSGGYSRRIGTSYYEYKEITKITPKRKRITCGKDVFDNFSCFCPISDETDRANEIYAKVKCIHSTIRSLTEQGYQKPLRLEVYSFLTQDYDEVIEILARLNKLIDKKLTNK